MGSPAGSEQGVFSSSPTWRQLEARLAALCQRADLTLSTTCLRDCDPPVGKYVCVSTNTCVHKKWLWLFWWRLLFPRRPPSAIANFPAGYAALGRDARLLFAGICFHHVSLGNLIQLPLAMKMALCWLFIFPKRTTLRKCLQFCLQGDHLTAKLYPVMELRSRRLRRGFRFLPYSKSRLTHIIRKYSTEIQLLPILTKLNVPPRESPKPWEPGVQGSSLRRRTGNVLCSAHPFQRFSCLFSKPGFTWSCYVALSNSAA